MFVRGNEGTCHDVFLRGILREDTVYQASNVYYTHITF